MSTASMAAKRLIIAPSTTSLAWKRSRDLRRPPQAAPDERPFVLTRAAYAGAERYAATWTGDNSATWNHIGMSVPQIMSSWDFRLLARGR